MTDYTEKARALAAIQCGSDDQCHPGPCCCVDTIATALREAHEAGRREQAQWRPIESAPRDGVPVLIAFREDIPARVSGFAGKRAVVRWTFDGGEWCYHGPLGMGGFPDEWIAGWLPLPQPPAEAEAGYGVS